MTTVGYCPRCNGQDGIRGFIHDYLCPYNPLGNVTWPTFRGIPESDNLSMLKDILDKLNEILKLLKEADPG